MSEASDSAIAELQAGRAKAAIALAGHAANQGDGDALALMATWRLIGSPLPRDLAEARGLLRRAVAAGHADSALTEVSLVANGTGAMPDWTEALRLMSAAAARHGGAVVEQLALIDAMDLAADGFPARLPEPDVLSQAPSIMHWRQFVSPAECAHIAMSVQDILEPSMVAEPDTGRSIPHPIRQSSAAPIGPTRESLPIQAILKRIAAATGTEAAQGESLTVLHYAPGQQYRMHMDALPGEANQRVATMILYLNEGYAGGETRFEANGLTFAARAGDALYFENVTPDGAPDPASRHAGLPVRQGTKWVATRWIRAYPFDVWKGPGEPL